MSVINFIRKHKNLPVDEVPAAIKHFDASIKQQIYNIF